MAAVATEEATEEETAVAGKVEVATVALMEVVARAAVETARVARVAAETAVEARAAAVRAAARVAVAMVAAGITLRV